MIKTVRAGDLKDLRFNETDVVAAVTQNIASILSTPMGSVPMQRDFGLDMEFLDMPVSQAKVLMVAPIREAVETWEPRARVMKVTFEDDPEHPEKLIPCVEVEINSE